MSAMPALEFSLHDAVRAPQGHCAPGTSQDASADRPLKRPQESLAPWRVKKAKDLMIRLMAQGCSIEWIARECAISRSHFSRAFKNATGMAPHDWFRREQIRRAEALLRQRKLPICQVAHECGFSDQSYFTRVFRQLNGISPKSWQSNACQPEA
ncbi:AraC family transcriptional regulator [Pseudomonas sp. GD03842]|uniref:helix-turn-helix transcriptional regulator n=1 Tax=Pseudomonas sp. GD03842 TaxID=2975385 RepID=UPI00244D7461|nr:AraC family transcriptional regulator [Pseudomonas sp. GD03842]MDH0748894.1 AraC family transcriptional regulator [Pseudomonas sp. GD03842]